MTNELVVSNAGNELAVMPVMDIALAIQRRDQIIKFTKSIMVTGTDFGIIPGTDKPTLLKPGAEKLTTFFGLTKRFEIIERVEDWTGQGHNGEPFFYYLYRCSLHRGALLIAEADGSCSTFESKYRWRWVNEDDVPPGLNKSLLKRRNGSVSEFAFAVDKAETSGPYGKPADYWQRFKDAIDNGVARKIKKQTRAGKEMDAWEIGSDVYRVPNDDIATQVNTVQKMAQKRALIAATLLAVNASEFFTQDLEDYVDGDFVANSATHVEPPAPPPAQPEPAKTNGNGGSGIGVTTGAELLELVNRRVGVPYDNVFHLQEAIKGDLPGFKWPSPKDKDGWQRAYDVAMAHAKAKEQPTPEPDAEPARPQRDPDDEIPF